MKDENSVLTVSSLMKGNYGVENISLSLPAVINSNGIKKVLELPLASGEEKAFKESAQHLKNNFSELEI